MLDGAIFLFILFFIYAILSGYFVPKDSWVDIPFRISREKLVECMDLSLSLDIIGGELNSRVYGDPIILTKLKEKIDSGLNINIYFGPAFDIDSWQILELASQDKIGLRYLKSREDYHFRMSNNGHLWLERPHDEGQENRSILWLGESVYYSELAEKKIDNLYKKSKRLNGEELSHILNLIGPGKKIRSKGKTRLKGLWRLHAEKRGSKKKKEERVTVNQAEEYIQKNKAIIEKKAPRDESLMKDIYTVIQELEKKGKISIS